MNRIPQDAADVQRPREVMQVTLDGDAEIVAARGLICMGYKFLQFTVAARMGEPNDAQEALYDAGKVAEQVVHALTPQTVGAVAIKFQPVGPRVN